MSEEEVKVWTWQAQVEDNWTQMQREQRFIPVGTVYRVPCYDKDGNEALCIISRDEVRYEPGPHARLWENI